MLKSYHDKAKFFVKKGFPGKILALTAQAVYNSSKTKGVGVISIEFELKFCTTPEILQALRQTVPGEETVFSMETTYYDTPDGALSRLNCTLRRRKENQRSVCTLKMPAEGGGRREYEVEALDIESALPRLCKLSGFQALSSLTANGVTPVCGARFTRVAKLLQPEGCTIEMALDSGVLTGAGKELPLCEVEFEQKGGSREAVCAFAAALAGVYGLIPESRSKFARALSLAQGE